MATAAESVAGSHPTMSNSSARKNAMLSPRKPARMMLYVID
jgi:hypothetical protein